MLVRKGRNHFQVTEIQRQQHNVSKQGVISEVRVYLKVKHMRTGIERNALFIMRNPTTGFTGRYALLTSVCIRVMLTSVLKSIASNDVLYLTHHVRGINEVLRRNSHPALDWEFMFYDGTPIRMELERLKSEQV